MRQAHLLVLLITSCFPLQAQYTPFFSEDFSSNSHQWSTIDKKYYMDITSDKYHIYNSEGKQPVISLLDMPFNEEKNYKIETHINQSYTPAPDGGQFGIFFGASDEKNGYAFVLDKYLGFFLLKSVNGKLFIVKEDNCLRPEKGPLYYGTEAVTILLESQRWKFYVNDSLAYSCLPLPWMGHKTGFFVSAGTGMIIDELNISESDPVSSPCPIAFTQEEFNTALNKIICAAPEDFSDFLGELDFDYVGFESWTTQNVALEGARKIYLSAGGTAQEYRKGKDFIITFVCEDSTSLEVNQAYFVSLQKVIGKLNPSCCTLEQADIRENLSDALYASVISSCKIKHASLGNVLVEVELDLVYVSSYYSLLLHVNIPKT